MILLSSVGGLFRHCGYDSSLLLDGMEIHGEICIFLVILNVLALADGVMFAGFQDEESSKRTTTNYCLREESLQ